MTNIEIEIIEKGKRKFAEGIINNEGKITFTRREKDMLESHSQKNINEIYIELNQNHKGNYKITIG